MKENTKLIHLGRSKPTYEAPVNVPVHRASTILSPDIESYLDRFAQNRQYDKVVYGALGTQNNRALAQAVAAIENGSRTVVTASGLSAITTCLSAFLAAGDHVLIPDAVYGPTRRFCTEVLKRFGVETTFYAPDVGTNITALFKENSKFLLLEAPGSLTFEMQDVPALCQAAKTHGLVSAMDNTWATPLYFKPLDHGVDLSIQAGTKYIAGHSDLVIGLVSARDEAVYRRLADYVMSIGDVAGPDDCYLALRGLRTLAVRLHRHSESALEVATWLSQREEVARILYPALASDPGHELWRRDFMGASSLFGLCLKIHDLAKVKRMVNALQLFHIGSSWGGFESLVALNTSVTRDVQKWEESPFLLRLHIGLEDPTDLIDDLTAAFSHL